MSHLSTTHTKYDVTTTVDEVDCWRLWNVYRICT